MQPAQNYVRQSKPTDTVVSLSQRGASQFDFLSALTADTAIDWSKTTMFHLDEYIGISEDTSCKFS